MNIKYGLSSIKKILNDINTKDTEEKLRQYSIINTILSRITVIAEKNNVPNYKTYKEELLWNIESICELDDGNGHSIEQHLAWAIGSISKIESIHCFNVEHI